MRMRVMYLLLVIMVMATVGAASPQDDFSAGKMSVDVNWRPKQEVKITDDMSWTPRGKVGNYDWGFTAGMGGKWALQYRQSHAETVAYPFYGNTVWRINSAEMNALYKINQHITAFTGMYKGNTDNVTTGYNSGTRYTMQVGVIAKHKLARKMTLFGIFGIGENLTNSEIGFSYELARNLEFNLNYRHLRVGDIPAGTFWNPDSEHRAKKMGFGLTYRFQ